MRRLFFGISKRKISRPKSLRLLSDGLTQVAEKFFCKKISKYFFNQKVSDIFAMLTPYIETN